MSRWFRFHDVVINDPKVLSLPEPMRWQWVAILRVVSKNNRLRLLAQSVAGSRELLRSSTVRLAQMWEIADRYV